MLAWPNQHKAPGKVLRPSGGKPGKA